jgi:hypothetical protein
MRLYIFARRQTTFGWRLFGRMERSVAGRRRKLGGLADESVRGAQRGLLVLLGSALIWVLLIWAGYQILT